MHLLQVTSRFFILKKKKEQVQSQKRHQRLPERKTENGIDVGCKQIMRVLHGNIIQTDSENRGKGKEDFVGEEVRDRPDEREIRDERRPEVKRNYERSSRGKGPKEQKE